VEEADITAANDGTMHGLTWDKYFDREESMGVIIRGNAMYHVFRPSDPRPVIRRNGRFRRFQKIKHVAADDMNQWQMSISLDQVISPQKV